jgi:hypothetical protein
VHLKEWSSRDFSNFATETINSKLIVENVKNIEEISKDWELSLDERR